MTTIKCQHCGAIKDYTGISTLSKCSVCNKYTQVPNPRKHIEEMAAKQAAEYKKQKKRGY